jgi:hypothetical protein
MKGPHIRKETWQHVKADFLLGKGSIRELAERYGLKPTAVEARCKREGWRLELTQSAERLAGKVTAELDRRAMALADRAQEFLFRGVADAEDFLRRIGVERERLQPGDVEALARLIQAWKVPVELGGKLLGTDYLNPIKKQVAIPVKGDVQVIGGCEPPGASIREGASDALADAEDCS